MKINDSWGLIVSGVRCTDETCLQMLLSPTEAAIEALHSKDFEYLSELQYSHVFGKAM